MARSRTTFEKGNTAAKGRGQPTAQLIANAIDEAVLNIVNDDRKKAKRRIARTNPALADELFAPTTDRFTAMRRMFEMLLVRANYGDKTALKIFWDRYMPRPKMPMVQLPGMDELPPDQAAAEVAKKVAAGEISPDMGDALIRVFSGAATIREMEANTRLMDELAEGERDARS